MSRQIFVRLQHFFRGEPHLKRLPRHWQPPQSAMRTHTFPEVLLTVGAATVSFILISDLAVSEEWRDKLLGVNETATDAKETSYSSSKRLAKPKSSTRLRREFQRFADFASIEVVSGPMMSPLLCMTPRDFLDSVIQDRPRPRIKRKRMSPDEVNRCLSKVPLLSDPATSNHFRGPRPAMFRSLGNDGLITYTEYLFLRSLLTRPRSGFRIAFDVIDTSGEGQIAREEFSQFCQLATACSLKLEAVRVDLNVLNDSGMDTTLTTCFFGRDGNASLDFDQFSDFVSGFQRELLYTEFVEYSLGFNRINEHDFILFLFKFSNLGDEELKSYHDRLDANMPKNKRVGFSFNDLELMTSLINNLDDFCVVARMYHLAGKSFSFEEFGRAAKICLNGQELSPHMIETVICLFDKDGSKRIDYNEFIAVAKYRHKRRLSKKAKTLWSSFKSCVQRKVAEDFRKRNTVL